MNPRLLILTAGFGEGHNAAARALAAAWDARHGRGEAVVADAFALASPALNWVSRRAYLGLINRAPWLWRTFYQWLDRSALTPALMRSLHAERRVVAQLVAREAPGRIACTYPVYAFMLQALAARGRLEVPWCNVVTDSITLHSLWWRAGAAAWYVPNEDSRQVLAGAGVEEGRVAVTGFPVCPFFADNQGRLAPPELEGGATPRVLYIVNSRTRAAAETARQLLRRTSWEVTCAVGRDAALQTELTRLAGERRAPTTILGWTPEIPRLLMTHHVVISKAGGATTQEALAAGCPMIVNQIVPGQEEGNYELLRRHGVGALAETPAEVLAALERAFAAQGRVWREWRAALRPLSRPAAAQDLARALEAHAGRVPADRPAVASHPALFATP